MKHLEKNRLFLYFPKHLFYLILSTKKNNIFIQKFRIKIDQNETSLNFLLLFIYSAVTLLTGGGGLIQ